LTKSNNMDESMEESESMESTEESKITVAAETVETSEMTEAAETTGVGKPVCPEGSPVAVHGKPYVSGTDLVDSEGNKLQLYGMSTHGIAWYPQYINQEAFETLRYDWNTNCVRLAMYTYEDDGYCTDGDKEALKGLIRDGVEYATNLGMYVIIDWHVLNEESPNVYIEEAKAFFEEMSALYKDYDNVIYEICNEPNRSSDWADVKEYANTIIPIIRANDSEAVILVGTPTWCQDCDQALADPLEYDNIMYVVHFYAATHKEWLRERVENCINAGLPIFISEFAECDASGNGEVDQVQGDAWMDLIEKYNLSYFCWNLANKAETSSVINTDCAKSSGWTREELTETGRWILSYFQNEK